MNLELLLNYFCAGCNFVSISETARHLSTRVREHLYTDKNSHIFEHLKNSSSCNNICNESYFKAVDSANKYQNLKIKEVFHITWPNLNKQVKHYNISLSI